MENVEHLFGKLSPVGNLKVSINYLSSDISPWTKLFETEIQVATTSRSLVVEGTYTIDDIWTASDIIYVRVRDKAGKRSGYFLGSDAFFINNKAANGESTDMLSPIHITHKYNGIYEQYTGNGYGVFPQSITSDGTMKIYSRYDVGMSRRINGTYKIEVFRLRYPDNISPFDI